MALDASGSVLKDNWIKSVDFAQRMANKFFSWNTLSRVGVIDFSAVANQAVLSTGDRQTFAKEIEQLKNRYAF